MTNKPKKECLACQKTSDEMPLISVEYRGTNFWICTQHFPMMIHRPAELAGKLPGAEKIRPSEIND
jgi:hypothetical protein